MATEQTTPAGEFGTPNTMGELLRLLEITEGHRETSPEILAAAHARLGEVKQTDGYKRLAKYSANKYGG